MIRMKQYSIHFDFVDDVDGCCYVRIDDAVEKRMQVGVHGVFRQIADWDAVVAAGAGALEVGIGFVDNVAVAVDVIDFQSVVVVGVVVAAVVVPAVFPLTCVCKPMNDSNKKKNLDQI